MRLRRVVYRGGNVGYVIISVKSNGVSGIVRTVYNYNENKLNVITLKIVKKFWPKGDYRG